MKILARFVVREPLGVAWEEQLLCRRVRFKQPVDPATLALRDAAGQPVPFQATDVERAGGRRVRAATLWFWLDLPADREARFTVDTRAQRTAAPGMPAGTLTRARTITGGDLCLRLPGSRTFSKPVRAERLPGPILGFGRNSRSLIGGSEIDTHLLCRALKTRILENGPLWTEAEVAYDFEHGSTYATTVRLFHGRDFAVIDERMALRVEGRVLLHLHQGLEPDRFYSHATCPVLSTDGHSRVQDIDYGRDHRLREIQVPVVGTYYVPHLVGFGGLFNSRRTDRGLVGIVGLDGLLWESAMHNRMRLAVRSGESRDVVLEMPIKAGRRRWALMLTGVDAAIRTGAGQQSRLLQLQIRMSETPLRDVLEMRLDVPRAAQAPLLFDDALLERARRRLLPLPPFLQRLEDVEAGEVDDPAFAYMMTGKREYACRTRDAIEAGLCRFLDILLRGGGIADGAVSTISLSRPIRAWAGMLDLIRREPDVIDSPQGRRIERLMLFWAHKMMAEGMWPHRRTALHQDHPESQKPLYSYPGDVLPDQPYWINCLPNFQSDWLIALAWIGVSYPGHAQARAWIDRCVEDLDAQFEHFVYETGGWVESMNYALYTLNYYCPVFVALRTLGVRDYFADERLHRWLGWHTRMLTPPDPRIEGKQTQAYVGNAILPDGQASVFNWYAGRITDDELAGRLVETWHREGSPLTGHPANTWIFEALVDPDLPARALPQTGSTLEPGFGAILRHDEGTREETFLTFKVGNIFSHYEGDELAFHWHARGVPLCSDYGVYQPASGGWDAHNVVEVPALDGIRRGFLGDHYLDADLDYLVGDHPALIRYFEDFPEAFRDPDAPRFSQRYNYLDHEAPLGPKVWIRRALLFVKPHYLVLLDDVDGVTPSRLGVHCVADAVSVKRRRIEFKGRFGMDLTVFVAAPAEFKTITGRHAPERGEVDHSQLFARISGADGANHYRTVLYPHRPDEKVKLKRLSDGVGLQVDGPCGRDRIWVAREGSRCRGKDYAFDGQLGFVREAADEQGLHLVRGTRLVAAGMAVEGAGPLHARRTPTGEIRLRADGAKRQVTVKDTAPRRVADADRGIETLSEGDCVRLLLPPGKQDIVLR